MPPEGVEPDATDEGIRSVSFQLGNEVAGARSETAQDAWNCMARADASDGYTGPATRVADDTVEGAHELVYQQPTLPRTRSLVFHHDKAFQNG